MVAVQKGFAIWKIAKPYTLEEGLSQKLNISVPKKDGIFFVPGLVSFGESLFSSFRFAHWLLPTIHLKLICLFQKLFVTLQTQTAFQELVGSDYY